MFIEGLTMAHFTVIISKLFVLAAYTFVIIHKYVKFQ